MVYVILFLSLVFASLGYLITNDNAKYLLSGYNTMSEKERSKVDLSNYIPLLRKFHLLLGTTMGIGGLLLHHFVNDIICTIFTISLPLIAYGCFMWISDIQMNQQYNLTTRMCSFVLVGLALFISLSIIKDTRNNIMIVDKYFIEIKGGYGEIFDIKDVQEIVLSNKPKLVNRTNGFAIGQVKKGSFKTNMGNIIKIYTTSEKDKFILIKMKDGLDVYFGSQDKLFENNLFELKKYHSNLIKL
jgi:hypothetical protein